MRDILIFLTYTGAVWWGILIERSSHEVRLSMMNEVTTQCYVPPPYEPTDRSHRVAACSWTMASAGSHWSGAPGISSLVSATSTKDCKVACCQDESGIGCVAFTYKDRYITGGIAGEECTLWAEMPTATIWSPGWTSGQITARTSANGASADVAKDFREADYSADEP
jgi:hypothetical protein